jgi:hypothetical protein
MQDWSPQQISGSLKMEYPNDESLRVSHETIYRSLFIQARGALKPELVQHRRSKRRIRRSRHSSVHGHSQGGASMLSPFANGQPKLKIVLFPVIGKAICCAVRATVT